MRCQTSIVPPRRTMYCLVGHSVVFLALLVLNLKYLFQIYNFVLRCQISVMPPRRTMYCLVGHSVVFLALLVLNLKYLFLNL